MGIRPRKLRQNDQGLPQGPAPGPRPGPGIHRKSVPERHSAFGMEESPSDGQVTGRIANGQLAEIDDGTQAPFPHQQVAGRDVPMHPDRRSQPGGGQGGFPDAAGGPDVQLAIQVLEGLADLGVIDVKPAPAMKRVWPCLRTSSWVDPVQGGEEPGEAGGELGQVADGGPGCVLARKPSVDSPMPGIAQRRLA